MISLSLRRCSMLTVGKEAPDFSVAGHDGKTRTLKEFRGKHVILFFFPKADTPG
jgi:peroxiredoxin Q/BCP